MAYAPGVGLGLATGAGGLSWSCPAGDEVAIAVVGLVEEALRPRWVWWSSETAVPLISAGVRVATCWDIAAVHRLLFGGWRADPARVWAQLHHLALEAVPTMAPPDLFSYAEDDGDGEDPVRPDGYLRPEWAGGGWARTSGRVLRWAELAVQAAALQQASLADARRPAEGGRLGPFGVDGRAALRRAVRRRAADGPRRRRRGRRPGRGAAPAHRTWRWPTSALSVTPRCCAMLPLPATSTCAARRRCARCSPGPGSSSPIRGHGG